VWSSHDAHLATDACLSGIGGISSQHYFHFELPHPWAGTPINILEALAVMVALKLWARQLSGLRVSLRCDNVTTVHAINNLRTRSPILQNIVREIMYICATHQLEIRAVHIAGLENRVPDWLSRWHTDQVFQSKFHAFNLAAHLQSCSFHPQLFSFSHPW
jgi:glutamine amidotransferase PdxT